MDARLADTLSRVDSGESGALWRSLQQGWGAFARARASGDVQKMQEALAAVEGLIQSGASDWAAWNEIGQLVQQRRKLVESERKRAVEMGQLLTIEQALLMLGAATDAISRHVSDPAVVAAIGRELAALADAPVLDAPYERR